MTTAALLIAISFAAPASAGEHLLAGADAFREGRLAEALVEFRVAERLGASEAGPYAGAVLVKLGRPEEAVEAFGGAPSEVEDALLAYYRAVALRGAGLLASADLALASIGDRSGPRIAAEVARLRGDLRAALDEAPSIPAIDALLARGATFRGEGRNALAAAFYGEAAALARRRADRYGLEHAERERDAVVRLAARRDP